MKYLILLLLFITSCTDKKESSPQEFARSLVMRTNMSSNQTTVDTLPQYNSNDIFILDSYHYGTKMTLSQNSISTNPIFLDTSTNLILSYGLTPELYILENIPSLDHYGYELDYVPDPSEGITQGTISNNTYYIYADEGLTYKAIYYEPKNNEYYRVLDMDIATNIQAPISDFNTNLVESTYFLLKEEYRGLETNIIYIADLSTNQRLFYKPDNHTYFIKTLHKIIDDKVLYINFEKTPALTNIPVSIAVYPALDEDEISITYTNDKGFHFKRNIFSDTFYEPENTSLQIEDSNFVETLENYVEVSVPYTIPNYYINPELFRLADIGKNKSIYWAPNKNAYYISTSMQATNSIKYQLNSDMAEYSIYYDEHSYISEPQLYVGSFTLLERVYLDTNDQQYIKTLELIDDTFIERYDEKTSSLVPVSNTYIFYPYTPTLYTNNESSSLYWWRGGDFNRLRPVD